jgi:integrase
VETNIVENLQNGDFSAVDWDIWQALLMRGRLDICDEGGLAYRKLGHGFLRARREANRKAAKEDKADFDIKCQDRLFDPDRSFEEVVRLFQFDTGTMPDDEGDEIKDNHASQLMPARAAPECRPTQRSGSTPTIRQLFEKWCRFQSVATKTAIDFETQIKRFCELVGDLPVDEVTSRDIIYFRDEVEKLPVRMTHQQRKMGTRELISSLEGRDDIPRLRPQTVKNKSLAAISAVLGFAVRERILTENVAQRIGVRKPKDHEKEVKGLFFSSDRLQMIVGSPVFSDGLRPLGGAGEAAFWVPMICMFTGARLTEVCGLEIADIGRETGIDYFFIRHNKTRDLKSDTTIRKIPIHSKLLEWGFLEYLEVQRKAGQNRVFERVNAEGASISSAWSAWWSRYLRKKIGILDPRVNFHSFRHTVRRELLDKEVRDSVVDAILGHSNGNVSERYGRDEDGLSYSMQRLKPAVEALTYENVDFSGLCLPKYKKTGRRYK